MEAPFSSTTWDGITGAIYAGHGTVEGLWLAGSLALVVVAIIFGWRHEQHAYKALEK